MLLIFFIIFILSLIVAIHSMNDFKVPKEIKRLLDSKKIRGTIIFFKDRIKRY